MAEMNNETGEIGPDKKRIVACLTDIALDGKEILESFKRDGVEVVWDARKSYGISEADSTLKWSDDFSECLGVVISGTDIENKPVSILLHILPNLPLTDRRFLQEFKQRIGTFMQKTLRGSVEIVVFGGRVHQHDKTMNPNPDPYKQGVLNISSFLKRFTGVDARIIAMPRVTPRGGMKIATAYNTAEKKLFIIRDNAELGDERKSFAPEELPEVINSLRRIK